MGVGGWIALGVLVAVVLLVITIYNRLVTLRNRFKNAFSQIDVQLKRRYDLIPNLVEAVKGYMAHERGTLEAVIKARGAAVSASERAAATPLCAEAQVLIGFNNVFDEALIRAIDPNDVPMQVYLGQMYFLNADLEKARAMFVIPGAPVYSYAATADGYTFTPLLAGSQPGYAVIVRLVAAAS